MSESLAIYKSASGYFVSIVGIPRLERVLEARVSDFYATQAEAEVELENLRHRSEA